MPSREEINQQLDLLREYRFTLEHYLKQQSKLGEAHIPPSVAHGIRDSRENIRRIKAILVDWNIDIENHPDDDGISTSAPKRPTNKQNLPTSFTDPKIHIGFILFLVFGGLIYVIPWVIMGSTSGFYVLQAQNLWLFLFGVLASFGSLFTKSFFVGGFIGGGLPLGIYALYKASDSLDWQRIAPSFTWFVVFLIIGGMIGALTAPAAHWFLRLCRLSLPFE